MALPNTPVPAYPNVPDEPGVPPLVRANNAIATVVLVVSTIAQIINAFNGPEWGIFTQDGLPLIIGDTVVSVGIKKPYRISNFPVEKGSFGTFNKVEEPYDARLSFTQGGSDAERAAFLKLVQQTVASFELFSVVMPEYTYESANVTNYNFERRQDGGVSLLTVEITVQEVRVTATSEFTTASQTANAETPSGNSPVDGGTVQPQAPTPGEAAAPPPT